MAKAARKRIELAFATPATETSPPLCWPPVRQPVAPLAGPLTAPAIDRSWPYQVALRTDRVTGDLCNVVRGFCCELSLCARGHRVHRDGQWYTVFCFAKRDDAELFARSFGGTPFEPHDRYTATAWFIWG
jgi:hypothetical protein